MKWPRMRQLSRSSLATIILTQYTVMPRGGHFAAHEEPDLLAGDITAFFKR